MAMVTAEFARAISRQIFQPAFRVAADTKHWNWEPLASIKKSDAALEQVFGYTGIGAAVATDELAPFYYGRFAELPTTQWIHTKYTLGGMVSQELIEDNKNLPDIVGQLGTMIGEGHSYIRDYTVAQWFNNAFSTGGAAYHLYDGAHLCDSHTLQKSGGSVTNYLTAASMSFDNLWLAINFFEYSMFTHEGLPMTDTPKYLLYHPSQNKVVRKILETDKGEPDTADNSKNTLTSYNIVPVPCRFLTTTYWFLVSAKFKDDLVFYDRISKEVKEDADFDRDAVKIRSRLRFSVKFKDWMHAVGNAGA
jgi:hypothetical protein